MQATKQYIKPTTTVIPLNGTALFMIAGGGTGGHIFPAIAIAHAIQALYPSATFLFVGAKGKMEMEKIPQAGFSIIGLPIAGFNRKNIIKNISLPYKILSSIIQVRKIIKQHKPIAVIGVGGYSTYPVLKVAQRNGIPTFIHESNSFAGKSNILLGKHATAVFVASSGMQAFFPQHKIILTGNPVRKNITHNTVTKQEAITYFKLDNTKKIVLIVGGSLGALSINQAIANGLQTIGNTGAQLIWQTGTGYATQAEAVVQGNNLVYTSSFIQHMAYAYAAADIIISRSGAMAIAELAIVGKPCILVPYPYATEDHQTMNATTLLNAQAALLVHDYEVNAKLISTLVNLIHNQPLQVQLSHNLQAMAISNADEVIATHILQHLQLVPSE